MRISDVLQGMCTGSRAYLLACAGPFHVVAFDRVVLLELLLVCEIEPYGDESRERLVKELCTKTERFREVVHC